jgi:hypothetical protein
VVLYLEMVSREVCVSWSEVAIVLFAAGVDEGWWCFLWSLKSPPELTQATALTRDLSEYRNAIYSQP